MSGSTPLFRSQNTQFSSPWEPHRKGSSLEARTPVVQAATSQILPLASSFPHLLASGTLSTLHVTLSQLRGSLFFCLSDCKNFLNSPFL